jgi:hypothetical protein
MKMRTRFWPNSGCRQVDNPYTFPVTFQKSYYETNGDKFHVTRMQTTVYNEGNSVRTIDYSSITIYNSGAVLREFNKPNQIDLKT